MVQCISLVIDFCPKPSNSRFSADIHPQLRTGLMISRSALGSLGLETVIDWANAVSTVVIAGMAILAGILTYRLFRENRLLRRANTQPQIVAYLSPHDRAAVIINFTIENIGQGVARDVKFTVHADPSGFEGDAAKYVFVDRKPFGIFPQGASATFYLGTFPELINKPELWPLEVSVEYNDFEGTHYDQTYFLDVTPFFGTRADIPAEVEIAKSLKDIEDRLQRLYDLLNSLKRSNFR